MYWIHSERDSELWLIEQSNLDGSSRSVIVQHNKTLLSLTTDFDSQRLYYVYDNSGIAYYDIARKIVVEALQSSEIMTISSVTVYNGSIYFPENIQSAIMSCGKDSCYNMTSVRTNTSECYCASFSGAQHANCHLVFCALEIRKLYISYICLSPSTSYVLIFDSVLGIHIYLFLIFSESIQSLKMFYSEAQTGTNNCAGPRRGGCEHLCLATSATEHVCRCAIGYDVVKTNASRCVGKSEFVFYSNHELKGIELYDPNRPESQFEEKPVSQKRKTHKFQRYARTKLISSFRRLVRFHASHSPRILTTTPKRTFCIGAIVNVAQFRASNAMAHCALIYSQPLTLQTPSSKIGWVASLWTGLPETFIGAI